LGHNAAEPQDLLVDCTEGTLKLIVPDLFWPEVGNILWKCARAGRISHDTAVTAMKELNRQNIPTFPSQPLAEDALEISLRFERPVYDAIYVALAIHKASPLITADERLTQALGKHFPMRVWPAWH
jgi:predicted nucleic acid-binding protein